MGRGVGRNSGTISCELCSVRELYVGDVLFISDNLMVGSAKAWREDHDSGVMHSRDIQFLSRHPAIPAENLSFGSLINKFDQNSLRSNFLSTGQSPKAVQ